MKYYQARHNWYGWTVDKVYSEENLVLDAGIYWQALHGRVFFEVPAPIVTAKTVATEEGPIAKKPRGRKKVAI